MQPSRRSQPYRRGTNLQHPLVAAMMKRGRPQNMVNPAVQRQQMLKKARLAQLLAGMRRGR